MHDRLFVLSVGRLYENGVFFPVGRRFPLFLVLCFFALALLIPHTARATDQALPYMIAGGAWDNPPFEFMDEQGRATGFSVEILNAIGRVTGNEVHVLLEPLSRSRAALKSGEVTILQGLIKTPQRERDYLFSEPVGTIEYAIFAKDDAPAVASLNDLGGKVVVVKDGEYMAEQLPATHPDIRLVRTFNVGHALMLLARGEADYLVCPSRSGIYYAEKLGFDEIRIMGPPVFLASLSYAVDRETGQALVETIDKGLRILRDSGEYQAISDVWLSPVDYRKPGVSVILRRGAYIIGPLLLCVLLFWGWSRILSRQVAQRTRDLENEVRLHREARHEIEVRQAALRRADRMASLGTMAAGIAHEINTPNGFMLLNLPILERVLLQCRQVLDKEFEERGEFSLAGLPYSRIREEIPQMLTDMRGGCERIKAIVHDLKDLTRSDSVEEPCRVQIATLLEDTVRVLQSAFKQAGAECILEPDGPLPPVCGRPMQLQQVFTNLVLNACEALPDRGAPGPRRVTINARHTDERGEVIVEIRDTGTGIPSESLEHISDPFFTTKREKGGTGLGLFVSANIIEHHGGRLEFESSPGGTTVRVMVPRAHGDCERGRKSIPSGRIHAA